MKNVFIAAAVVLIAVGATRAHSQNRLYDYIDNPVKGDECATLRKGTAPKSWRLMNPFKSDALLEKLNKQLLLADAFEEGQSARDLIGSYVREGLIFNFPKRFRFIVTDTYTFRGKKKKGTKFLQFKLDERYNPPGRYFQITYNAREVVCRRLISAPAK